MAEAISSVSERMGVCMGGFSAVFTVVFFMYWSMISLQRYDKKMNRKHSQCVKHRAKACQRICGVHCGGLSVLYTMTTFFVSLSQNTDYAYEYTLVG